MVLLLCRFMVTILAHVVTLRLWPGYNRLKNKHKLAWCNRIASGSHVRYYTGQDLTADSPHSQMALIVLVKGSEC